MNAIQFNLEKTKNNQTTKQTAIFWTTLSTKKEVENAFQKVLDSWNESRTVLSTLEQKSEFIKFSDNPDMLIKDIIKQNDKIKEQNDKITKKEHSNYINFFDALHKEKISVALLWFESWPENPNGAFSVDCEWYSKPYCKYTTKNKPFDFPDTKKALKENIVISKTKLSIKEQKADSLVAGIINNTFGYDREHVGGEEVFLKTNTISLNEIKAKAAEEFAQSKYLKSKEELEELYSELAVEAIEELASQCQNKYFDYIQNLKDKPEPYPAKNYEEHPDMTVKQVDELYEKKTSQFLAYKENLKSFSDFIDTYFIKAENNIKFIVDLSVEFTEENNK